MTSQGVWSIAEFGRMQVKCLSVLLWCSYTYPRYVGRENYFCRVHVVRLKFLGSREL